MMAGGEWLIDERNPLAEAHIEQLDRELAVAGLHVRGSQNSPALAVRVKDIVIHDNKKWFGEADIRLDALVVNGYGRKDDPQSFYMLKTASFSRIKDGDRLPIGDEGLLVFYGPVSHFLDIVIMASRDRKDADDLSTLLTGKLQSAELKDAAAGLLGLAVAAPPLLAVTTAISAAAALGDFAYRLLRSATGTTIGLYRNSFLQFRDGFGIGQHPTPPTMVYRVKDLSFRYEIIEEKKG